jgi:hypothetical protein
MTAATLALWTAQPIGRSTGAALAVTAVLNIVRLARWAGDRTCRDRLVLILHIGYAFVPLGFLLSSAASLEIVMTSAAVHAWTVGAAATMTLAVMTRASLGHTGNPLVASPLTQAIFAAVVIAAFARICASIQPAWSDALLHVTALAWCVAFSDSPRRLGPSLWEGGERSRRRSKQRVDNHRAVILAFAGRGVIEPVGAGSGFAGAFLAPSLAALSGSAAFEVAPFGGVSGGGTAGAPASLAASAGKAASG